MSGERMNGKQVATYAIIAIVLPIIAYHLIFGRTDLIELVAFVAFTPILVLSAYMWIEGGAYNYINVGVQWSAIGTENAEKAASHVGKYLTISMILLMYGISAIMHNLWIFIIFTIISVVLCIVPVASVISLEKVKKMKGAPKPAKSKAWLAMILITAVAVVPSGVLLSSEGGEKVIAEFGETSFTVKAPMFNHTFEYSKIASDRYFDDFDKGQRIMGYGGNVCSGQFKNSLFGKYYLASYAGVKPCFAISYEGEMYAFNMESVEETQKMYNTLKSHI